MISSAHMSGQCLSEFHHMRSMVIQDHCIRDVRHLTGESMHAIQHMLLLSNHGAGTNEICKGRLHNHPAVMRRSLDWPSPGNLGAAYLPCLCGLFQDTMDQPASNLVLCSSRRPAALWQSVVWLALHVLPSCQSQLGASGRHRSCLCLRRPPESEARLARHLL